MRVVTAFCLACVCAELLVQLVEAGWARRCIKVVAPAFSHSQDPPARNL